MPPPGRRLDATGAAAMLALCLVWGVQQVGTKLAAQQGLLPLMQAGLRSSVSVTLLVGWVWLREGRTAMAGLFRRDRSTSAGMVIGAVFTLEFAALFEGVALTAASRAILLLYTAPFFVAIGSHLFLPGERLRPRQVAGLCCAFGGVALVTGGSGAPNIGDALVVLSAALWAATTIIYRASALATEPPTRVLFYQLTVSACILVPAALLLGQAGPMLHASRLAWGAFTYQAVVVSFASYTAWFALLARYSPKPLSAFTFLTPLIGIAFGAVVLDEHVSPLLILAFLLVAAGLPLVNSAAPSREAASATG